MTKNQIFYIPLLYNFQIDDQIICFFQGRNKILTITCENLEAQILLWILSQAKIKGINYGSAQKKINPNNHKQNQEFLHIWTYLIEKSFLVVPENLINIEMQIYNSLDYNRKNDIKPGHEFNSGSRLNDPRIKRYFHTGSVREYKKNKNLSIENIEILKEIIENYHFFTPSAGGYYPLKINLFCRENEQFISKNKKIHLSDIQKHINFSENIDYRNSIGFLSIDFDTTSISTKYGYKSYKLACIEAGFFLNHFSKLINKEMQLDGCILGGLNGNHIDNNIKSTITPLCGMVFGYNK